MRAVLAEVAVLEGKRLSTTPDLGVLLQSPFAIVGVYELDEGTRHQFLAGIAQCSLPGWIELLEVSVEVEKAEHVDRIGEEAVLQLIDLSRRVVLAESQLDVEPELLLAEGFHDVAVRLGNSGPSQVRVIGLREHEEDWDRPMPEAFGGARAVHLV